MPVLVSSAGQRYAVDYDFRSRLLAWDGIESVEYKGDDENFTVTGTLADIIDFLTEEGVL